MKTLPSTRCALTRLFSGVLLLTFFAAITATRAADVTWDGGTSGTGVAWLTPANWDTDTIPGANDNAIFGSAGTVLICGINLSNFVEEVGSITIASGRASNLTLRNSSTTKSGTLVLNGIGGILLSNETSVSLTITNGTNQQMALTLGASGDIFVAGTQQGAGGQITIYSSIAETNGSQSINKVGGGILYLRGVNSYSGTTTLAQGSIKLDGTGNLGNGAGDVYLNGGDIISGADRSGGIPLANTFVLNADTYIYSDSGTANTSRTLPISGALVGNNGTLRIANLVNATGNTFLLRLLGGFTFSQPIEVGSPADTSGSFSALQLYNPATNGVQVFSGNISGQGIVRRQGSTASDGGTTIFTGDNTYSGGTLITYGTLLANNTSGSALGSGQVTVTNAGILGGNGTITAPVSVSLGGTISPGESSTAIGNLNIQDLTLGSDATYVWQIASATGTPGTAWDLINILGTWTDAAIDPINLKIDSLGVVPTGWNGGVARDWTIIQGVPSGFDPSHFVIDITGFAAPVSGIFSLNVVGNALRLSYTPAPDVVLNVASGTKTQSELGYSVLTGTVGVSKIGNGEAVLDNSANDYAGSTKILAGTMSVAVDALNGSGAFGNASTAIMLGDTSGTSNATLNINTSGVTVARSVAVQSGSAGTKTIEVTAPNGTGSYADVILQDDVTLSVPVGSTGIISGVISGTNGITKIGAGTFALTNVNTYSGKTKILEGTLSIDAVGCLGDAPATLVEDQITIDGGTLEFTDSTASSASGRGFRIGPGNAVFNVTGGTLTINGPVSGTGNLIKTGSNLLQLNSPDSSYSGDTFFNDGEISVDGDGAFGDGTGTLHWNGGGFSLTGNRSTTSSTFIPNPILMTADTLLHSSGGTAGTSRIIVFSGDSITTTGGTLTISNYATAANNTFDVRLVGGGFEFTQPILIDVGIGSGGISQLYLGNTNGSEPQTFSGIISGNGRVRRSANVTSNAGTSILTAANTYSGGTFVSAGTLLVNNTSGSGTGSGDVSVTGAGILGGTGIISGAVSGSGTISPGNNGVGTLTLQNGLDQSNSGDLIWELGANTTDGAGVNFDQLNISGGNLLLGGTSALNLLFTGSATAPDTSEPFWQAAHSWRIISLTGGSNPGDTVYSSISNGSYAAGNFTVEADANGIVLNYTPNSAPPVAPTISSAIVGAGTPNATLSWSAQTGVNYEVQYKTNLNQIDWLTLGTVTADSSTASFSDTNGPSQQRFYRILAQ
jgi:fibronectin-binding autotransporter adhesin